MRQEPAPNRMAGVSAPPRWLLLLFVVFAALVLARAMSEGVYDMSAAQAGASALIAPVLGHTRWVLATTMVLFGIGFTVYLRSTGLVVRLRAPSALLGTWHGLIDAVERVACAAAIPATGFAFDRFGGTALYAVFGGLLVTTAVLWSGFTTTHREALGATPLHPVGPPPASSG